MLPCITDITIIGAALGGRTLILFQNGTQETLNKDVPMYITGVDYGETENDLIVCSSYGDQFQTSTVTNFTQDIKPITSSLFLGGAYRLAYDWLSKNIYFAAKSSFESTFISALSNQKYIYQITNFYGLSYGLSLDCDSG